MSGEVLSAEAKLESISTVLTVTTEILETLASSMEAFLKDDIPMSPATLRLHYDCLSRIAAKLEEISNCI
jgi:hypothetical protein